MRKINTASLEDALEQIIRIQTAGGKASIKPRFVAGIIKELIDRRKEEELIFAEVEDLFGSELAMYTKIVVDEVTNLSQLGTSSFDLEKAEWRVPEGPEEPPELDESDVIHDVQHKPVLRSKRSSSSGAVMRGRWDDGGKTKRMVVYALLAVIALTFGSLLLV